MLGVCQTNAGSSYQFVDLGTLGGQNSYVAGLNNSNVVVGTSDVYPGKQDVFLYQDDKMTNILSMPGSNSPSLGWGPAPQSSVLNNNGVMVGSYYSNTLGWQAFTLTTGGQLSYLPNLPNQAWFPYGINDQGQVVGM